MSIQRVLFAALLLGLSSGAAFAEEAGAKNKPSKVGGDKHPSMEEMMKAMEKYSEPGEMHKRLQAFVGSWTTAGRFWMDPSQPPTEITGSAEAKFILGGRFVAEEYTGTFMGKPFMGHAITGYDLAKKKFTGVWMDNMGTGMMTSEGTMDPSGKTMTMIGNEFDPMTGKSRPTKMLNRIESDQKHVLEFYEKRNGKEMKTGEIVYTRRQTSAR